MNWGVAQEVEYLLCQVQTPVPPKKKKRERKKGEGGFRYDLKCPELQNQRNDGHL
jgi:hypothetical protein